MKQTDDKVRCNLCESNFTKFGSFGFFPRENALCPKCKSLESTRVLWFYLSNEVLTQKNKSNILYFLPEPALLNKLIKYDIALTECGLPYLRKLKNSKADEKLPGGKYDVILFSHVLQKIKNEELVFEELKRLLRPGGFALIQTLIDWKMERTYENPKNEEDIDRLKPIFEPGIERIYGANFKKQLVNTGFHVEMIDYADLLGNYAQTYYQLGNGSREIIFKCKKYKIT